MTSPRERGEGSGRRRRHRRRGRLKRGWLVLPLIAIVSVSALGMVLYQLIAAAERPHASMPPPSAPW